MTIPGLSAKSGGSSTCTLDLMNGLKDIDAGVKDLQDGKDTSIFEEPCSKA